MQAAMSSQRLLGRCRAIPIRKFAEFQIRRRFRSGTEPFGIDNAGQIVGFYTDPSGNSGFIEDSAGLTALDVTDPPGAFSVALTRLTAVPEPSGLALLGVGLIGFSVLRRRGARARSR